MNLASSICPVKCLLSTSYLPNQVSPFKHTLVFAYTNRSLGYVAKRKVYGLGSAGGYEASSTRRLSLDLSVEEIIQQGIVDLLGESKRS